MGAAFAPTHHPLAVRHASTCMVDEAEEMQVDDFLALATPEELEQARQDKEARLQARGAGIGAAGEGDTPEELEQARQEKEDRLARVAALRLPAARTAAFAPTHHPLAVRHNQRCMH